MRFLLRAAFWLAVVGLFVPAVTRTTSDETKTAFSATDAALAAGATIADLREFCTRRPEACAVGSQVAAAFGEKAQAGAKALVGVLTETIAASEKTTGSTRPRTEPARGGSAITSSQSTLDAADLATEWRGPLLRREAQRRPAG